MLKLETPGFKYKRVMIMQLQPRLTANCKTGQMVDGGSLFQSCEIENRSRTSSDTNEMKTELSYVRSIV